MQPEQTSTGNSSQQAVAGGAQQVQQPASSSGGTNVDKLQHRSVADIVSQLQKTKGATENA